MANKNTPSTMDEQQYNNTLYSFLYADEDARACRDIDEASCNAVPRNFFWLVLSYTLNKLADALCNPKTTLTWLLAAAQVPPVLIAWLVPIRESGSMLPQLFLGAYIRRYAIRKWAWVVGCALQALSMLAIAFTALFGGLSGTAFGLVVIGCLTAFSLSRGICSIAAKDVMGKTIAKQRRGRVSGLAASIAGGITLAIGALLVVIPEQPNVLAVLIAVGATCWLLAAISYSQIIEQPGATGGAVNGIATALANLKLLRTDKPFGNFVLARGLFLVSALSAPWYLILAREHGADNGGANLAGLGLFVLAGGLADLLSSHFWGRMADSSSRNTMMWGAGSASALSMVLVALVSLSPTLAQQSWLYPLAFFLLGISHAGVRLGRQTYVVDLAGGNKRTDYVSVSNTVIGALLLVTGALGLLEPAIGASGILLILALAGFAGIAVATRLPAKL